MLAGLAVASCGNQNEFNRTQAGAHQPYSFATSAGEADTTCKKAQALVAGIPYQNFENQLATDFFTDLEEFIASKPSIAKNQIVLKSYVKNPENDLQEYENIWCKLKSQDAVVNSKDLENLPPATPGMNCDQVQKLILEELLANDRQARIDYEKAGIRLTFNNHKFATGQKWSPSEVEIRRTTQNQIQVTTSSLESPRGIPIIGGMHYCKLISTQGLRKLVLLR